MLYFKSQPKDLTPIKSGVVFTVGSTEVCDIEVEIIDCSSDSVVATKVIRAVDSAEIDIAPYITGVESMLPKQGDRCALEPLQVGLYKIAVSSDVWREESNEVRVSCNNYDVQCGSICSTMPLSRTIGAEECDDICFVVEPQSRVQVIISSDSGSKSRLDLVSQTGVVQLHIAAAEFSPFAESLEVAIYVDNNLEQMLIYTIEPQYRGSVQVAWIAQSGMPERYSFPVTVSKSVVAERKTLFKSRAEQSRVECKSTKRIVLRSHSLTDDMAERVSIIVCSPKVWLVLGGELVEASVLDSETVCYNFGKAASCQFTFEYGAEEVVL